MAVSLCSHAWSLCASRLQLLSHGGAIADAHEEEEEEKVKENEVYTCSSRPGLRNRSYLGRNNTKKRMNTRKQEKDLHVKQDAMADVLTYLSIHL